MKEQAEGTPGDRAWKIMTDLAHFYRGLRYGARDGFLRRLEAFLAAERKALQ